MNPGDEYILAEKYVRGVREDMYTKTDKEFYVFSDDVRFVDLTVTTVAQRRGSRRGATSAADRPIVQVDLEQLNVVKSRVCIGY